MVSSEGSRPRRRALPPESSPIWSAEGDVGARDALVGDRTADVVVVGAGIAGLSTALILARQGVQVVVLEGRTIGCGTTGHTTAKVSALQGTRYQTISQHHSADVVAAYADAQRFAVEWIASLVDELDIDCDWERRTAYTYATDVSSLMTVQEEAVAAAAAGLDVEVTREAGLPFDTTGAVALAAQGQFDPLRYLHGLARELDELPGAVIHEQSRVTGVRGIHRQKVTTEHGSVRAGTVVICTLLPIVDRGLFFARGEPKMSYTIAAEIEGDPPRGMYLSAGEPSRSLRTARHQGGELLVVGGEGHVVGRHRDTVARYEALADWTAEHFDVKQIRARWCAHDVVPSAQLPWVGTASPATPGVLVAGGFAKWGMTNATAGAHLIADRITGSCDGPSADWARVFDASGISSRSIEQGARTNLGVAANMVSGWLRTGNGGSGEGSVERSGVVPTGRSAGPSGETQDRSLVCSHLGGICAWNRAERTWDCPLHGSRFASDGTVVAAPAVRPMGSVPLPNP